MCEGEEIHVHKAIIAGRSEYFKGMFNSKMNRNRNAKCEAYDVHFDVKEFKQSLMMFSMFADKTMNPFAYHFQPDGKMSLTFKEPNALSLA